MSPWINLFEVLTDSKSDKEKILTLTSYLESDAQLLRGRHRQRHMNTKLGSMHNKIGRPIR